MTFTRHIADGIHRVADGPVNWYLVEDDDGVTIVDAGLPASWNSLGWALAEIGRKPADVRALVLTHAHFDHVGFAERARRELGVPVYLHADDRPLSRHPLRYDHERHPLLYLWKPGPFSLFGAMVARGALWVREVTEVVDLEADDGRLAVPGRPRVLHTPGHTLGHVALHFADRDALIAGDAVVMLDPYTAQTGPRVVARAATADSGRALASLDALAGTGARVVLTGHGEPWTEGVAAMVQQAREAGAA
jgi:glyoxylase-like metal-dependent hydrolase (beta-lactamase superfamily II)